MTREGLIQAGVDYDNGVRRFMGKPHIYEKYLMKFFEKNSLPDLRYQLETGDYELAFRTAHGIKGVCGNLSLGQLYDRVCELVEFLRGGGHGQQADSLFRQIMELYNRAGQAVWE